MADKEGPEYMGQCDGCETQTPQPVRDVSGEWGASTVCRYHGSEQARWIEPEY